MIRLKSKYGPTEFLHTVPLVRHGMIVGEEKKRFIFSMDNDCTAFVPEEVWDAVSESMFNTKYLTKFKEVFIPL